MLPERYTYIKKRDCTVAVPLLEALVLPLHPNKQHRSPRRYVRTHTHPHGAYGDRYTYPEDIKMLQCVGCKRIYQIPSSQAQSANDAFIMSCNCPTQKT